MIYIIPAKAKEYCLPCSIEYEIIVSTGIGCTLHRQHLSHIYNYICLPLLNCYVTSAITSYTKTATLGGYQEAQFVISVIRGIRNHVLQKDL